METIEKLVEQIQRYQPGANLDLVRKAYQFAEAVHRNTSRLSGEPYIAHPIAVASIVAQLHLDESAICAALLHDCLEDSTITRAQIESEFGQEIANVVDGLTKLSRIQFHSREQQRAENYRKMIVAMARDLRVLLVKLCDRVHNMRTLDALPLDKQRENAEETRDIFAPLANRLGIQWIKVELEDLAFRFLKPAEYRDLAQKVNQTRKQRADYIATVIERIGKLLDDEGFRDVEVQGRPKHLWSIYRKMQNQQIDFSKVYDVVAFRVLVQQKVQCYEVLAHVHSLWRPIPGRFKDYIANPKENGYKSLHTSVIGPGGQQLEVQIRTYDMHVEADNGIAAHWKYKEGRGMSIKDEQRFYWLKRLVELQREVTDPTEFLESVRYDLFEDEVYVFTPQGDVRVFPAGATVVDFAYAVHSEVGHRCRGAKINGQIVPLSHKMESGDSVEILTGNIARPNKDWLEFVTTPGARHKIRAAVRREQRELSLELGRSLLEREFRRFGRSFQKLIRNGDVAIAVKQFRCGNVEELCVKVGEQRCQPDEIVECVLGKDQLQQEEQKQKELTQPSLVIQAPTSQSSTVKVDGIEDILIRFARCCRPLPGESIIGFVSRGRGIIIHAQSCSHAAILDPSRKIDVGWDEFAHTPHPVTLLIKSLDRPGILAQMAEAISKQGVNITHASCETQPGPHANNFFQINVRSQMQLKDLVSILDGIEGVLSVERVFGSLPAGSPGRASGKNSKEVAKR